MQRDIHELDEKVQELSGVTVRRIERNLNVIIRGLPFHEGENFNSKVNSMIRDGIKLFDFSTVKAVRKESHQDNVPGLVIATFQSEQEASTILKAKNKLKDSDQCRNVFLGKDLPTQERAMNRNVKVLVDALRQNGCNVTLHGNRVERHSNRHSRSPARDKKRSRKHSGEVNEHSKGGGDRNVKKIVLPQVPVKTIIRMTETLAILF